MGFITIIHYFFFKHVSDKMIKITILVIKLIFQRTCVLPNHNYSIMYIIYIYGRTSVQTERLKS